MSITSSYRDPIIQKIIDIFEADGPSRLQARYINGDVLLPSKSELPICYITKNTTAIDAADNMEDEHKQALIATVILDWADDLQAANDIVAGVPDLYDWIEGRDENFLLKKNTLMYLLLKNQKVADKFWIDPTSPITVEYGLGIQRRGPGIFSVEAVIRFNALLHLANPEFYVAQ